MFPFFQNRKVINIAYSNGFHAKKNFSIGKKFQLYEFVCHTGTRKNLFTSNISVTTLIEFEGLPAKTWKILREIFLELPWCCSGNPPNCIEILINTWRNGIASGKLFSINDFPWNSQNHAKSVWQPIKSCKSFKQFQLGSLLQSHFFLKTDTIATKRIGRSIWTSQKSIPTETKWSSHFIFLIFTSPTS